MSKDSFAPGELIGIIKFVFDKTKSRTLNATQAYDVSSSQIVLGSYSAKASKKSPAKSLEDPTLVPFIVVGKGTAVRNGTVVASVTTWPTVVADGDVLGKDAAQFPVATTVGYTEDLRAGLTQKQKVQPGHQFANGVTFNGIGSAIVAGNDANSKTNANKEIYYGAITVAIGEYRTWQGKYAVLKVDLLTDKAVLRVYDE
jgi:hypothetical protein